MLDDQLLGVFPLSKITLKKAVSHVNLIKRNSFSFQKSAGISPGPGDSPFFIAFIALMGGIGPAIWLFSSTGG